MSNQLLVAAGVAPPVSFTLRIFELLGVLVTPRATSVAV